MIDKTFEELGEYREQDGYINMDRVLTEDVETDREVRGNVNREKEWFDIKGGRALIKTNAEDMSNSEYSELICCELAKQAGIQTAKYDMVRHNGQTGLITENVCKPGEEMISLQELIGTSPDDDPDFPDTVDIYYVFDELEEKLALEGLDENQIDQCLLDLRKQLLFDLCVMETDRHTENISFIKSKVNGKVCMRLAPMYDTESALALYNEPEQMKKIYSNVLATSQTVAMQEPKISVLPDPLEVDEEFEEVSDAYKFLMQLRKDVITDETKEYGSSSEEMCQRTFDFLCEDERVLEYWKNTLSKLDITKAIDAVEQKIGTKLPEDITKMAIACFEERKASMEFNIPSGKEEKNQEYEIQTKEKDDDTIEI